MLSVCLLAVAVCVDTFFAAMGCSMSGITIPRRCALLISVIGSVFLGISLTTAQLLETLLPPALFRYGGAAVLCVIGGVQIMKQALTSLFRRRKPHIRRTFLGLVIDICFDETLADADHSKTLNLQEAGTFAAALSLDSLASGLGAGISRAWILPCLALTFVLGFALTLTGAALGKRCRNRPLQWLGGAILLVLAICRIAI